MSESKIVIAENYIGGKFVSEEKFLDSINPVSFNSFVRNSLSLADN